MGVSLGDLFDAREIVIARGRGELRVRYRTDILTPADLARWQEAERTSQLDAVVAQLASVIEGWDLVGPLPRDGSFVAPGAPVPVTAEALGHLPTVLLNELVTAILADYLPNVVNAGASSSGSSPMETAAPARTGGR